MTRKSSALNNVRPLRHPVKSLTDVHRRWATAWPAVLYAANASIPCKVENVSMTGAQLFVDAIPLDDTNVSLAIETFDSIVARIAWRRRERVGIQFAQGQPWIIDVVSKAARDSLKRRRDDSGAL
jgi:PilZ domain